MFKTLSARDRIVNNVDHAEERVITAIINDQMKWDRDVSRAQRRRDRRMEKIQKYERQSKALREQLEMYDALLATKRAKDSGSLKPETAKAKAV